MENANNTPRSKNREPLIRIIKRRERTGTELLLLYCAAFFLAIIAGGIFLCLLGHNPLEAYGVIIKGAFKGSKRDSLAGIRQTIIYFVPLLMTSLGLSLAFKMKFWNIGGEGQIIMGGIFASVFALYNTDNPGTIPTPLLILLMFVAGALGGGLMGLIPAVFKVAFGTNETLFTLMLNYIAFYIMKYLVAGPWKRTPGYASIGSFDKSTWLWEFKGIHAGLILAIGLIFTVFVYLRMTKSGYEISVVGESQPTARYAGMNVKKIILRTMFISGAICGIVGMINISTTHTISEGVTGGVGFTAITVSWLSQLNPFIITLVSAMFSILQKGSSVMQSSLGISSYAADVLQGIILFSFLGCQFFTRYSFAFRKSYKNRKEAD